jgi:ABC-2 type transport system ATP-binding protein
MDAITIRNLSRRFGNLLALENINLRIPSSSLYGLIGPNGAGKTTTIRILAGLLEPTSGEVRINGLSTRKYQREIQWQIGFMPDIFGIYEDLLVWEYIDFFARCYKLSPARRRQVTDELLELVDLQAKRNSYVHKLSRGMRQRLCLAHALVHDPDILLLDEPSSGLDPNGRLEMRELLLELKAMGKTILLSSHILSDLAALCDSIAVIGKGRILISGTIDQIRQHMGSSRSLHIQVRSSLDEAESMLKSHPNVERILGSNENNGTGDITIEFSGGEEAAANLLGTLISNGVRINSFSQADPNLEEIFLQLTKGEVS